MFSCQTLSIFNYESCEGMHDLDVFFLSEEKDEFAEESLERIA